MLLTVQLQAYLRVTVDVVDVNDPPRFADQQETIAVTEVSNYNICMTNYEWSNNILYCILVYRIASQ